MSIRAFWSESWCALWLGQKWSGPGHAGPEAAESDAESLKSNILQKRSYSPTPEARIVGYICCHPSWFSRSDCPDRGPLLPLLSCDLGPGRQHEAFLRLSSAPGTFAFGDHIPYQNLQNALSPHMK